MKREASAAVKETTEQAATGATREGEEADAAAAEKIRKKTDSKRKAHAGRKAAATAEQTADVMAAREALVPALAPALAVEQTAAGQAATVTAVGCDLSTRRGPA